MMQACCTHRRPRREHHELLRLPIRLPVSEFAPSKSQMKTLKQMEAFLSGDKPIVPFSDLPASDPSSAQQTVKRKGNKKTIRQRKQ